MSAKASGPKTIVITGASRGLGAGMAQHLAAQGHKLGLCARSTPPLTGPNILSRSVDVRDEGAVEAFAQEVQQHFGDIDAWINNAGILDPIGPVRTISQEDFAQSIDINLTGVLLGTQAFIRHIRSRPGTGVLINISSGAALAGYAGWGAYCAGKSAVDRLTECVALEEAEAGLRAHAVAPGVVDTDMQTKIRDCTPSQFPMVQKFIDIKREERFNSPQFVADRLIELITSPPPNAPVVMRLPSEQA